VGPLIYSKNGQCAFVAYKYVAPVSVNRLSGNIVMASKRLQQESFRKRRKNFIRRGHEISSRYEVAVWICIQKDNGQLYVYNSNPTRSDWPPSSTQLVGHQNPFRIWVSNVIEIDISSAYSKD
jgi:hypothetical protein